jgi:hypothetical protein
MPRKAYIADLKRLSTDPSSAIDGISDVRSGDDDGEFRFKVTPLGTGQPYEISALIPGMHSAIALYSLPKLLVFILGPYIHAVPSTLSVSNT